jgi:hypothetical protein
MQKADEIASWLLEGDPSIVFQTKRDLLGVARGSLETAQRKISREGWGKAFLDRQNADGHWGRGAYQPKWICTHYTLQDLKTLAISPDNPGCRKATELLLASKTGADGGVNYARTVAYSDVCINGMLLNIASYFTPESSKLNQIVDYILERQFEDGGWNCMYYLGATHSSVHTTIGVLEGLIEYGLTRSKYRSKERANATSEGLEFLLRHRLYKSERTGEPFDPKMQKLSFPYRWKYDILRALEAFVAAKAPYDERMTDAMNELLKKRRPDCTWLLQSKHPGQTHFEMEKVGKPSRWNTLRVLRTLKHFHMD